MNTKQQGDIGVAHAIYYYTLEGYKVSIPNTDSTRYDLIVDKEGKLYRVQCKTTFSKSPDGNYMASLRTMGGNQSWGGAIKKISAEETDLVWVSTGDREGYEFPVDVVAGMATVTLGKKYLTYKVL